MIAQLYPPGAALKEHRDRLETLVPPSLRPAELVSLQSPFDDDRFIFELKHDGFRALADVTPGGCGLISRRGNVYKSFRPLRDSLSTLNCSAVLDGELVSLDQNRTTSVL